MPKLNFNSRDNVLSTTGMVSFLDARVNQYVLDTSSVLFNSLETTNDIICHGNISIDGNLTVSGNTTIIETDVIEVKDNILLINATELGAGVTANLSGFEVDRGSYVNFQSVYQESTQLYKIGEIGNLQAVATREDTPLDKGILVYNQSLGRLDSSTSIELPISFTGNIESFSSSTGTIKVAGGIGASGNIYLDKSIHLLGSDYTPEIKSNASNDLIITSGNHITLTGAKIKIDQNTDIQLGSSGEQNISNTDSNINISATSGNLLFSTQLNGQVNFPEKTFLRWGLGDNDLTFDSTDINLRSTGKFNVFANMTMGSTDASVSPTVGSFVLNGGLSISSSVDSVNSDNGGTFTTAGGIAIKKQARIGGSIDIGDTDTTVSKGVGLGINFRSLNKTLTNNGTDDITFNSFEGGNISSSSVINEASTVFITGAPTLLSGGGSITNSFALTVNSGKTKFSGDTFITSTTTSSSSSVGALVVSGGISIDNSTNSSNSAIGGAFTVKGGGAIGKDLYIGNTLIVGDTNFTGTQILDRGINFRSNAKTLTTSSSINTVFNSFDGGYITSSATIDKSATVFIKSQPLISGGGTITNAYALLVESGMSRFDGRVLLSNNSLDSLELSGGIKINNVSDSSNLGSISSLTTLGGASISKNLLVGNTVKTFNGSGSTVVPHLQLAINSGLSRFSFGLKDIESSGDLGSNLELNSYSDNGTILNPILDISRKTSDIVFNSTTSSNSISTGAIVLKGGLSVNNSAEATDVDNGGTFTTGGGASIKKKLFVGGETLFLSGTTIQGTVNLNKTIINTDNGTLDISGNNGMNATLGNTSNLSTSLGSLTLESINGGLILDSLTSTSITAGTSITITSSGNTTMTNSSGDISLTAVSNNITSSAGDTTFTSSNKVILNSGTGGIICNTTDTILGIKIGVDNIGVPVDIGHLTSEVKILGNLTIGGDFSVLGTTTTIDSTLITINDNAVVVNAAPSGISDGGLLMRRYQTPNDTGTGQVVNNVIKETGTFQTGSSIPGSLILSNTSSIINNYYRGWWIRIISGSLAGTVRRIKSYNGTTKNATIYTTVDNNPYNDGLDLISAPLSGDNYNLFDSPYAGIYFSENAQEIVLSAVSFDVTAGTFGTPTSYLPIHVQTLVTEEGLTLNGDLNVYGNGLIKNNNSSLFKITNNSDGMIFNADTINNIISIGSPANTINTGVKLDFTGLDSVNDQYSYAQIRSKILNNVSGNLESAMIFKVQSGVLDGTDILTLDGNTMIATFDSQIKVLDTTDSLTKSSGSLVIDGGLGINTITDATDIDNGGALTVGGGASIKMKVFIGGETVLTKGTSIGNTINSIDSLSGTLNVSGDISLYDSTKQSIYFSASGTTGLPSFINRSSGSKIILKPSISATTVDSAIGTSLGSVWISAPDSASSITLFLGETNLAEFNNGGIVLNQLGSGVSLAGATIKSISENKTVFSPQNNTYDKGFIFTDSSGAAEKIRINGLGQLKMNITNSTVSLTEGTIFDIGNAGITDTLTIASGTASLVASSKIRQNTLDAVNTDVTTTIAATSYIEGAVILGANESFVSANTLYLDSVISINTGGAIINSANTLYIKNSPFGNNITKARSILVESGISEFGGETVLASGKSISTTNNSIGNLSGSLNISGDIAMHGSTRQSIYFSSSGSSGIPTFTNRSDGSKIILNPSITTNTVDSAIGTSSSGVWLSAANSTKDISLFLGTLCKIKVTGDGLLVNSGTNNSTFKIHNSTVDTNDDQGITINGGGDVGYGRGSQLELFGNEMNSGDAILSAGAVSGRISLKTDGVERLVILSSGETFNYSTTDSSSSVSSASIKTLGGISVAKSVSVGTLLNLDFNQPYTFSGESSGALNIQSKVSSIDSSIKYFTNDGDATDSNNIKLYGKGTPGSQINTELLLLGFNKTLGYLIKTEKSGSGSLNPLILQSNENTEQIKLNTDGTVKFSSTSTSSSTSIGAITLDGGISISNTANAASADNGGTFTTAGGIAVKKDTYIGGNLVVSGTISSGISSPSITIYNSVNTVSATIFVRTNLISNGNNRSLSVNFRLTPLVQANECSFEFDLPDLISLLANIYDISVNPNGYSSDATPVNIENITGYGISGTTKAKIKFTAASTDVHTVQVIVNYSI